MIEKKESRFTAEDAFLVGEVFGNLSSDKVSEHLKDLELLAKTAGANVNKRYNQKLNRINPSFFKSCQWSTRFLC